MDQRQKAALDRHITGNYGEDQLREEPGDESGRPPIDAPVHEHRRWMVESLETLLDRYHKISTAAGKLRTPIDEKMRLVEAATHNFKELFEQLVVAYMQGNETERKTLEFARNEFDVVDDGDYTVVIEEYANRQMTDPPRYRLLVHHGTTLVLSIRSLTPIAFGIPSRTIANINGEGP